jgi:hypothetical protein
MRVVAEYGTVQGDDVRTRVLELAEKQQKEIQINGIV